MIADMDDVDVDMDQECADLLTRLRAQRKAAEAKLEELRAEFPEAAAELAARNAARAANEGYY